MGVLLISSFNSSEQFEIPFLKETIQWYSTGDIYHVIRLFLRPITPSFSGLSIVLERSLHSVQDKSDALKDKNLLNLLKERKCEFKDDNSIVLDDYHYLPISPLISWDNIGTFSEIKLSLQKPLNVSGTEYLLAFLICAKAERKNYSLMNLAFFGSVEFDTYILMPPSTLMIETNPISNQAKKNILDLESNAAIVKRYEIWIATGGLIEAVSVNSTISPKRNRSFKGASVLEEFYNIPPMKRGWELSFDFRKDTEFFNESIRCTFKHEKFFLILAWGFGIATLAGLILTLL